MGEVSLARRRATYPGLRRLTAVQLGLGVLLLAATGTTQAQYEAEPWVASLTSSSASVTGGLLYGYDRDEGTTGTLSITEFAYEDTTYTVRRFGQINNTLVPRLRPSMDTSVRGNLTALKVDKTTYAFPDATHTTVGTGDDETSQIAWQ